MFSRFVFEVTEVKGGRMVKKQDFEVEKNQNKCKEENQISNYDLMLYGHFPARNGSKLHNWH